jgi:hypothetical protein
MAVIGWNKEGYEDEGKCRKLIKRNNFRGRKILS